MAYKYKPRSKRTEPRNTPAPTLSTVLGEYAVKTASSTTRLIRAKLWYFLNKDKWVLEVIFTWAENEPEYYEINNSDVKEIYEKSGRSVPLAKLPERARSYLNSERPFEEEQRSLKRDSKRDQKRDCIRD